MFFERISYTFSLMGASWEVLKKDKELLLFPALSGICCLLVIASFAIPMFATGNWQPPAEEAAGSERVMYYGLLFLFYFCNYFVMVFFNTAVISCAVVRMQGGDPTVSDGLNAAFSRVGLIFGWALVSATVGIVLRIIEDRSEKVGRIVAGLLGAAWSLVTFLAVPVMVVEKKGPIASLKRSAAMLRQTWGEQLIGNFGFGVVFFLLAIPGGVLIVLGFLSRSVVGIGVCVTLAVVYFIILALVQSALNSIFRAALYLHALGQDTSRGIDGRLLEGALRSR